MQLHEWELQSGPERNSGESDLETENRVRKLTKEEPVRDPVEAEKEPGGPNSPTGLRREGTQNVKKELPGHGFRCLWGGLGTDSRLQDKKGFKDEKEVNFNRKAKLACKVL